MLPSTPLRNPPIQTMQHQQKQDFGLAQLEGSCQAWPGNAGIPQNTQRPWHGSRANLQPAAFQEGSVAS